MSEVRSIYRRDITRASLAAWRAEGSADDSVKRPRTRGECVDAPRPCPFVACKHHLFLDFSADTGTIKFNFPGSDPNLDDVASTLESMPATCSLDVADEGGATLERVGETMNVTRENVRQRQEIILRKIGPELVRLRLSKEDLND